MRKISIKIKRIFFPSEDSPLWMRILPYIILGVITIIVLSSGMYAWDYTNSSIFCGTTCHTMPPEYTSYLQSPHARVQCVECHIGRDVISVRVTRKAGDIKHIIATIFKTYTYPIQAHELRPSQFTCERCHFPQKFSDDSLRQIKHFNSDSTNTTADIFIILKTGGGSKRQGLGRGIHWHIENKVSFYSTDPQQQDIPYIRVVEDDGTVMEYLDQTSEIDPETIDEQQMVQMDCITCHNRITHLVMQPEDSIDQLLSNNLISSNIPDIRLKAIEVLRASYTSTDEALQNIGGLENYYKVNHPEFFNENANLIKLAVQEIQSIYNQSVYPEQKSNWTSHPNNVGHKYFPGCFRCHDGEHVNTAGEAIRLECNLCHSIPVVSDSTKLVTNIEIPRGPEPQSHKSPNWIKLHNNIFDETCSSCHNTSDPGGVSNTSFCSNGICHATVFTYADIDAPKLREQYQAKFTPTPTLTEAPALTPTSSVATPTVMVEKVTYDTVIGPLLKKRCSMCHGEGGVEGLNMTTYATLLKGAEDGPVIIPGDPQNSKLVQMQSGTQPHFGQLTPEELKTLIHWIQEGAPEK